MLHPSIAIRLRVTFISRVEIPPLGLNAAAFPAALASLEREKLERAKGIAKHCREFDDKGQSKGEQHECSASKDVPRVDHHPKVCCFRLVRGFGRAVC